MNSRKKEILTLLSKSKNGMTAAEVAEKLMIDRSNASRYMSELYKSKHIEKTAGRPVVYSVHSESEETKVHVDNSTMVTFDKLVGENDSLKVSIQQAKAAILYPPKGLHTIIFGETGTGKSMFAECMYHFAVSSETLPEDAPFISFNCADYSQNPQLLFGHIFGIKKGAYTGANEDSPGLIAKANGGILFLDEIHRLPPEGQEMLFTFIDKGIYRPLGESAQVHEATVQIIGATTESSNNFLTTFNRRIPMAITLPNLSMRSLDERYEIVSLFIKQEANRLNQRIDVEREVVLAFMLYDAEGNIGQIKRDLKLVCAKAFLHYRTHNEKLLTIRKKDLSLQVQKGLLKIKELPERFEYFSENQSRYLTFETGLENVVWSQDKERDMQVYNTIEEKVASLSETGVDSLDLETLISKDVDEYFQTYVHKLAQTKIPKDLLADGIWELTNRLYDVAQERLDRNYNEQARFAFALHLQSTIDRIKEGHIIVHPDLNTVRKELRKEFQVALDLSSILEEEQQIEVPFDEIGFISMFLSIDLGEHVREKEDSVGVILLMHGDSTATSMLATAQELLGLDKGIAIDMPLSMDVQTMYDQVLEKVRESADKLANGLLLLTDMGSLNTFGNLIYKETGIRTKAVSMTSTMIVLDALRMAANGRTLEDIHQSIQMSFEAVVRDQFKPKKKDSEKMKAIVVTCFTGEGVAAKLYQRLEPVINQTKTKIIQMQFLERESFKKRINALQDDYDIKAIAGTVDIDYQNILFFSAYDVFDDTKLSMIQQITENELPVAKITQSLEQSLDSLEYIDTLVPFLDGMLQQIQGELSIFIEPGVDAGILIHTAFMLDALVKKEASRTFDELEKFIKLHRWEFDVIHANMLPLERMYHVTIPEDEIAFLVQMLLENQIKA